MDCRLFRLLTDLLLFNLISDFPNSALSFLTPCFLSPSLLSLSGFGLNGFSLFFPVYMGWNALLTLTRYTIVHRLSNTLVG